MPSTQIWATCSSRFQGPAPPPSHSLIPPPLNPPPPSCSLEKLREHAKTFWGVTQELPGTVAAGDGVCINIQAPSLPEVDGDLRSQFSRKGFYTYSVVVFCDAALRIMAATAEQCGSTGMFLFSGGGVRGHACHRRSYFAQVTAWCTAAAGCMI